MFVKVLLILLAALFLGGRKALCAKNTSVAPLSFPPSMYWYEVLLSIRTLDVIALEFEFETYARCSLQGRDRWVMVNLQSTDWNISSSAEGPAFHYRQHCLGRSFRSVSVFDYEDMWLRSRRHFHDQSISDMERQGIILSASKS